MATAVGHAPVVAAEFSFMLGIIAVVDAAILTLPDLAQTDRDGLAAIGAVAALVWTLAA